MQTVCFPVSGVLAFIDFEYAGFNYEGFEIGNHFAQYVGNVNNFAYLYFLPFTV